MGELHKEYLLSDAIAESVFVALLKPDSFTDDTIEAAIKFIEKVGPGIEERIADKKAKGFNQENYDAILTNFREIMEMTEDNLPQKGGHVPSNRIKLMIKNTLEKKEQGWKKQKSGAELKTKEEIEAQELKKQEEK